jgi:hypothetical protein
MLREPVSHTNDAVKERKREGMSRGDVKRELRKSTTRVNREGDMRMYGVLTEEER